MPGPDGDAVDQEFAQLRDDARGEVLRTGRRARVDDHQVVVVGGRQHARPDGGIIIDQRRQPVGQPAPLAHHRGQHQRVVLDDGAGVERGARRHQFGAGGLDRHARFAADAQLAMARAGRRADVLRPQPMIGRQDQLGRDHVLAHRPDMLPRRHRGEDLDG